MRSDGECHEGEIIIQTKKREIEWKVSLMSRAASAAVHTGHELQGLLHTQCFWVPDAHQLRSQRHLPHRASSSQGCVPYELHLIFMHLSRKEHYKKRIEYICSFYAIWKCWQLSRGRVCSNKGRATNARCPSSPLLEMAGMAKPFRKLLLIYRNNRVTNTT